MFLDASAIVAILKGEDSAGSLIARMKTSTEPLRYSLLVVFEVVVSLVRQKKIALLGEHAPTPPDLLASTQVSAESFLRDIGATEVELSTGLHSTALDAARTCGSFVGHSAEAKFRRLLLVCLRKATQVATSFRRRRFREDGYRSRVSCLRP